jgi:spermidine/putrescine transport system permease protein
MGIMAMKKRTRNTVMSLNQIPIINADIVTAFAVMLFFVTIGITNAGWFKLILAHTLISVPFVVLAVLPRFRQLDPNLFEAGQDLGASPIKSLFFVVIPQLVPAMVAAFFLAFTLSLDDFIVTLYNSDGIKTISTMVYGATKKEVPAEFRALSAAFFFIVLSVLLIYNWRTGKKLKEKKHETIK